MTPSIRSRAVLTGTGAIYAVIGVALAAGGLWLLVLGGSVYYAFAGLGIAVTGALLLAGSPSALLVYAAVLIGTLIWAVAEIGFDWWPLAARGDIVYPLGLWLLARLRVPSDRAFRRERGRTPNPKRPHKPSGGPAHPPVPAA